MKKRSKRKYGLRLWALVALVAFVTACGGSQNAKEESIKETPQGGTTNEEAIKSFESAVELYKKGEGKNLAQVQGLLEEAVDEDPNFGKAWFNLGIIHHVSGRTEEAREAYSKAKEVSPALGDPIVNLGMLKVEAGQIDEARMVFEEAIQVDKFNPAAHSNISVYFRKDKDFPKAVRHARLSLAGDSQNLDAYANLARAYFDMEAYDVALLVCLNAEKIDEKQPDISNIKGLVWLAKNDVTEAIRQFKRATELDPEHVPALMNLGAVILNVRDYEGAIKLFDRVLALEPNNTEAKISIAVARRGMGNLEAAEKIYAEVQQADPQNALVQFNLGVLEHEHLAQNAMIGIGRGEPPQDPVKSMDWTIGNMEEAVKHYQKAIDHYRQFLDYDRSDNMEARNDANDRIAQVQKLIDVTSTQIPELKRQKIQLEQDMKAMAEEEKRMAEEAKAAEEAEKAKAAEGQEGAAEGDGAAETPAEGETP